MAEVEESPVAGSSGTELELRNRILQLPAGKLLSVLGILDSNNIPGTKVIDEWDANEIHIRRLELDTSEISPELDLLRQQLANPGRIDLTMLDFLYDKEGYLLAVFPVHPLDRTMRTGSNLQFPFEVVVKDIDKEGSLLAVSPAQPLDRTMRTDSNLQSTFEAKDILEMQLRHIQFSQYYFNLPSTSLTGPESMEWMKHYQQAIRPYRDAIQAYRESRFPGFLDIMQVWVDTPSNRPYIVMQVDPESGEIVDDQLDSSLPPLADLPEKISLLPYPMVYAPRLSSDQDYYQGILTRLNLEEGEDVLVCGPGVGFDSGLAWLKTRTRISAVGISPLEVINTELTAEVNGFDVDVIVGDNIIDEYGIPRFNRQFDVILWNTPRFSSEEPRTLRDLWDGDYQARDLQRFLKGLPLLLKPGGRAFIWKGSTTIAFLESKGFHVEPVGKGALLLTLRDENSRGLKSDDSGTEQMEEWSASSLEKSPVHGIITDSDEGWVKEDYLDLKSLPVGTLVYIGDTGQSIGADGFGDGYPIRYLVRIEKEGVIKLWFGDNRGCYMGPAELLGSILFIEDGRQQFTPGKIRARAYIYLPYFKWRPGVGLLPLTDRMPNELTWDDRFPFFRVLYSEGPETSETGESHEDALVDMLIPPPIASQELTERAKSILKEEGRLREFLGVGHIDFIRYEIARVEDDFGGYVLRFILGTESEQVSFYAKLRHSSTNNIEQLKQNVISRSRDRKVEFTEIDPDGDWVNYKIAGFPQELTEKRRNPTTLEYRLTLDASRAGVFSPSIVIADTLVIRGIDNGISLERLPNSPEWIKFFLENEEHLVREIGRAYGRLNKRARVLHYDIRLDHIFITEDRRIYLIDLSTQGEEGPLSLRWDEILYIEESDIENVNVMLYGWLNPSFGLGKVLKDMGEDYSRKEAEYSRWVQEGYDEILEEAVEIVVERGRDNYRKYVEILNRIADEESRVSEAETSESGEKTSKLFRNIATWLESNSNLILALFLAIDNTGEILGVRALYHPDHSKVVKNEYEGYEDIDIMPTTGSIVVRQEYQHRGIGTRLHEESLKWSINKGYLGHLANISTTGNTYSYKSLKRACDALGLPIELIGTFKDSHTGTYDALYLVRFIREDFNTRNVDATAAVRTTDNDFFGVERERYLQHVNIGRLPEVLRERANSYPWPIDMANPYAHIVGFYGVPDLLGEDKEQHLAIDLQTEVGTEVRAVEDGFVVKVDKFDTGSEAIHSDAYRFADVWIYSPESNLLWLYLHLDKDTVPSHILEHHWFNANETEERFEVKAGDLIGKVNRWLIEDALKDVAIPETVENIYGRTYNHLHFDVRFVDTFYNGFNINRLTSINPLQLLRPLYDLSQINLPVNSKVINAEVLKRRFDRAKGQGDTLLGFMRDKSGKIQPLFSDSPNFESDRDINILAGTYNPKREIKLISLKIEKVNAMEASKSSDWDVILNAIKDIFDKGNILVTSESGTDTPYSILMAVTPADGSDRSEGRTGVLLKDGLPIVIDINGVEFIVEIKGVGNPDGGYDYSYKFLRGGAQVDEADAEFINLENKRSLSKDHDQGNTVRAVANMHFDRGYGMQGYLIRLSPGSIRGTYSYNKALSFVDQDRYPEKISYCMGKQMAEFYSQGLVPCSHPENLIVVDSGSDFIFTDYSDILPIYRFPGELEGQFIQSPLAAILRSLSASEEIQNYNYTEFLKGLAEGLIESGKIEDTDVNALLNTEDLKGVADFVWQKFLLVDYYKARRDNGYIPYYLSGEGFDLNSGSFKNEFLQKLVQNTVEFYEENKREIRRLQEEANPDYEKIRRLEAINQTLESTGFIAEGIIENTDSEALKQAFKNIVRRHDYFTNYYLLWLWRLWDDNYRALESLSVHLNEEIEFLEQVYSSVDPEFREEIRENIELAKLRLDRLFNMTPYDYYIEVSRDPTFPFVMAMLPCYFNLKEEAWRNNKYFHIYSNEATREFIEGRSGKDVTRSTLSVNRERFLEGAISTESFVKTVMEKVSRSGLQVSSSIAQSEEEYRFGDLFLKNFADGDDPDTNLVVREYNSSTRLLESAVSDPEIIEKFTQAIRTFLNMPEIMDWASYEVLEVTLEIIRIAAVGDADRDAKKTARENAFSVLSRAYEMAERSEDPIETALRISTIGNSLDLVDSHAQAETLTDRAYLSQELEQEIGKGEFWRHEHVAKLMNKISNGSKNIVFVFDNAGEDVLDFILIKELLKLGHTITLAGKSAPAANDTTRDDLAELIEDERIRGLLGDDIERVKLIDTGTMVQGTDLMRISEGFHSAWNEADLIIFKGQSNYLTVRDYNPTKDCFFALKVKWSPEVRGRYERGDYVAEYVDPEEDGLVVERSTNFAIGFEPSKSLPDSFGTRAASYTAAILSRSGLRGKAQGLDEGSRETKLIKEEADGVAKKIYEYIANKMGIILIIRVSEGYGRDEVKESFRANDIIVPDNLINEINLISQAAEKGETVYRAIDGREYAIKNVITDVIEGTTATVFDIYGEKLEEIEDWESGAISANVVGPGVDSLGNCPDYYGDVIVTIVPPEKKQGFIDDPLDPEVTAEDPNRLEGQLKRIADANGININDLEVVVLGSTKETARWRALERLSEEYSGLRATRIKNGTVAHGLLATFGRRSGKHKVLMAAGGAPEGFLNLATAGIFKELGALASLRIYSGNANRTKTGESALDLSRRYDFTGLPEFVDMLIEKIGAEFNIVNKAGLRDVLMDLLGNDENIDILKNIKDRGIIQGIPKLKSFFMALKESIEISNEDEFIEHFKDIISKYEEYDVRKQRPLDGMKILNGLKLFTQEDVEGEVEGNFAFITNNGVFGVPGAQELSDGSYKVKVLRVRKINEKPCVWFEDKIFTKEELDYFIKHGGFIVDLQETTTEFTREVNSGV
ncbi:GNAT family N-acetyltransferase [Candidatus Omnitrophota bacterium]